MSVNPQASAWGELLLAAVLMSACVSLPAAADDVDDNVTSWIAAAPSRDTTPWGLLDVDRALAWSGPWDRAHSLTGNWGGWRDRFADEYGLSLLGDYTAECAGNPLGGERRGATYTHNIGVSLLADLGKLVGLKETYFIVSAANREGTSLSDSDIGNVYLVQQIYGGQTTRLVHLALGKRLFGGRLDLVAGRIEALDDFFASPLYCNAQNAAFCGNPFSITADVNLSSYPETTWGARGRWLPVRSWYLMGGVYNAYAGFRENRFHGTDFSIRHNSGAIGIMETGFMADEAGVVPPELQGHAKLGGYYDTEPLTDFHSGDLERGTWGIYLAIDQQLYAENASSGEGLTVFAVYHHAPPDVNAQTDFVDLGVLYRGAIPGRDSDVVGFYFAYGWFSGDLRASQVAAAQPGQVHEAVLEVNYRWNVLPWFYVQPDVQGILNPGAAGGIDDALVLALQFGFPF